MTMQLSDLRLSATHRSFGRALRVSFLGVALIGSAAGLCAAGAVGDAPQMPPAPLLDKPLPPSTPASVGDQPSPPHVFISGHWRWQDGAYVWDAGHWELPPAASASWVAPRWEKQDNGYVLVEGYWQEGAGDTAEASAQADTEVVEVAPPPPEREIIVDRPSPAHVWIGGYWGYRAGKHVWISGRWDLPPRQSVVWVAPHWARRGHGYVFIPGCWRDSYVRPRTTVVVESDGWRSDGVVTIAPPPPRYEHHRPPRPGFEFVWIDGYWAWHGRQYVWIGGRWDRPPHGHRHWESPRWEHRHGNYIFIEGRWR